MEYKQVIKVAYQTSKFKEVVPEKIYYGIGMLFIGFIRSSMHLDKMPTIRFPGLCLFKPAVGKLQSALNRLKSLDDPNRQYKIDELEYVLNRVLTTKHKNTKIKSNEQVID